LPQVPEDFAADFARKVRAAQALRFAEGLAVIPGAFELLGGLQIPFCVATNGPREKVELTLSLTGLRPYFPEHVFSAYEVGIFKPDPGLFLHAAKALGVAPQHCAVVEDSLPGIEAGLAAGMRVFCLLPESALPTEWAMRVRCIRDLRDLDAIFNFRD
jgi:HAD superfamily hydrolase (TIGR01509 family)